MATIELSRAELLRHRFARQGLAAAPDSLASVGAVEVLDIGVQDTGPDGHGWALAVRGAPTGERERWVDELILAWTLRGAPHAFRRADAAAVAVATSPFSDADAAKRIFDGSKPLRAAGLGIIEALRHVADEMRGIVAEPTVKGDLSTALTARLDAPYLRDCRPCNAVHAYEQPFRLSALQAGLVLEPATSPPVLHRLTGLEPLRFTRSGGDAEPRVDVVRGVLRFAPGSTARDVTAVLDGAAKDVKAHLPDDTVVVSISDGPPSGREPRLALAEDADLLAGDAPTAARTVRLLGPFDPYLQLRDRELLVPDETARKDLWRTLGRPGAVVADGEPIGSWRPRSTSSSFSLEVTPWRSITAKDRKLIAVEAERLAAFRGRPLRSITYND